jgi:hypothetical protein
VVAEMRERETDYHVVNEQRKSLRWKDLILRKHMICKLKKSICLKSQRILQLWKTWMMMMMVMMT